MAGGRWGGQEGRKKRDTKKTRQRALDSALKIQLGCSGLRIARRRRREGERERHGERRGEVTWKEGFNACSSGRNVEAHGHTGRGESAAWSDSLQ